MQIFRFSKEHIIILVPNIQLMFNFFVKLFNSISDLEFDSTALPTGEINNACSSLLCYSYARTRSTDIIQ